MSSSYARNRRLRPPSWYVRQRVNRAPNPAGYKGGREGRRVRRGLSPKKGASS